MKTIYQIQDDPQWPVCGDPTHTNDSHWCDNVADKIRNNVDVLETGLHCVVPIVPAQGVYGAVQISPELSSGMAETNLILPDGEMLNMGLWFKGEGRATLVRVLLDWLHGQEFDRKTCNYINHGFAEEMNLQAYMKDSWRNIPNGSLANDWCLAYHGMCLVCFQHLTNAGPQIDPSTITANDTGLGDLGVRNSPNQFGQTRTQLRNRFGSGN